MVCDLCASDLPIYALSSGQQLVPLPLRIANNEAALNDFGHWVPVIARLRANPFAAGQSGPVDDQHEDEEGRCCDRGGEGNLVVHVVNPSWMAPVNACDVTEFHVARSRSSPAD